MFNTTFFGIARQCWWDAINIGLVAVFHWSIEFLFLSNLNDDGLTDANYYLSLVLIEDI